MPGAAGETPTLPGNATVVLNSEARVFSGWLLRGHTILLLADAAGSRSEMDHRLAIHEMREFAGIRVTAVESIAWELLGSAEGDAFKALLTLLK